jgi:hypothetical protein
MWRLKWIILTGISAVILLAGCRKDDIKRDNYIEFSIQGPDINKSSRIEVSDKDTVLLKATGLIYPEADGKPETAIITYQDSDPTLNMSFVLRIPTKAQLLELLWDEHFSLACTDHSSGISIASRSVSMNVTHFEKRGPALLPLLQKFEASGTFQGVMMYIGNQGQQVTHTISGRFEFANYQ